MKITFQIFLKFVATLILFFVTKIDYGQTSQFQKFSVEEGLPQSQIYAILSDHNHRLWLGTKGGGVCSFDGENFKVFNQNNGIADDKIFALFQDNKQVIWVGTGRGVFTYDGLQFQKESIIEGRSCVVSAFVQDNNGRIWVATNIGLFYQNNGSWSSFSEENDILHIDVSCLHLDEKGILYAGNDDGLYTIQEDGSFQHNSKKQGLTSNKIRSIQSIGAQLFVGTYGGGLNVYKNEKWEVVGSKKEIINHVFVDQKKQIWLATHNNGVVRIKSDLETYNYFTTNDGLSTNHIRVITQDVWGNIWIGTSGGGLNKMFNPIFEHYNKKSGFKGNMFYAIAKAYDSSIWVATSGNGIAKLKNDSITLFNSENGFKDVKSKALYEDYNQVLWVGTEGNGMYYYLDGKFHNITGDQGLADNWIREITMDKDSNLWIATVSGISKITYQIKNSELFYTIKDFTEYSGLLDERINCIKVDSTNRVWFGSQGGYIGYILDDNVYISENDKKVLKSPVKSIDFDEHYRIWIATEGNGIFYAQLYNPFVNFNKIGVGEGLNNNNVYLVKSDKKGSVWAGAGSGIDEIQLNAQNELTFIKHYAKNEGFLGGETCSNAAVLDKNGNVWIGTLDGLNCYKSSKSFINTVKPKVFFEDISVFYESITETNLNQSVSSWFSINESLNLTYEQNHLSFYFNAINLINPNKTRFQYRLVGFEKEWSPLVTRNFATYSNLPPGKYTFEVKAVNEDGVWSDDLKVGIFIETPYWQTFWFFALLIGFGVSIVAIVIALYFRRHKKRLQEERHKLNLERNMLELEQKTLRLQMNPHFIFNAMNTVQALIAQNDTKEARCYLAKFSKLMRKILENSRHTFIAIQDEIDALDCYLNLEQLSNEASFDFEFIISDNINTEVYGIPPLMLQPFVENAIVHGLKEIDYKGKIVVSFQKFDTYIECSVLDNGRGRKAAGEVRHQKSSYHKSTALILTQERLAMLGSDLDYKSFEIIDHENPSGTEIIVRIPLKEIY